MMAFIRFETGFVSGECYGTWFRMRLGRRRSDETGGGPQPRVRFRDSASAGGCTMSMSAQDLAAGFALDQADVWPHNRRATSSSERRRRGSSFKAPM